MPRVDLQVPFHAKDEAKKFGARWDATQRIWYAPDGTEIGPLKAWLPAPPRINVRAPYYFIAQTQCPCWKCERDTDVWALIVPPGHEQLSAIEDPPQHLQTEAEIDAWEASDESSAWIRQDSAATAFRNRHLAPEVQRHVFALTRTFYKDFSSVTQNYYWMNHCTVCGMKQGDFTLIEEFDSPFQPLTDGVRIRLHTVYEAVELQAGTDHYEPGVFESMPRTGP